MSSNPEMPTGDDDLQFDRAEFAAAQEAVGMTCAMCRQPIAGAYYEVNGQVACTPCHQRVRWAFFGGSRLRRAVLAALAGSLAGLLGTGIYFGVEAVTGYHIGLVAIVVGLLVGGAVRKGSAGRGGWFYQLMAIFLTYASISGSYFLTAMEEIAKEKQSTPGLAAQSAPASDEAGKSTESTPSGGSDQRGPATTTLPGPVVFVLVIVFVIGISLYLPIMAGMQSPILLIITGFALYEAWKLNKRPALRISGPYTVDGDLASAQGVFPPPPFPPPESRP
jgi:hypothetical protein